MSKILVVDDEKQVRLLLKRIITENGWECSTASSSEEARKFLARGGFELLLTDIAMPGEAGLELLKFASGHRSSYHS